MSKVVLVVAGIQERRHRGTRDGLSIVEKSTVVQETRRLPRHVWRWTRSPPRNRIKFEGGARERIRRVGGGE
jgi:hypothetical protein